MNVLLTGATGYIGSMLFKSLKNDKQCNINKIITVGRNQVENNNNHFRIKNLDSKVDWKPVLNNIDVVIHVAGVAHNNSQDFDTVNNHGTLHLAEEAAKMKVKRFIFISTIGVNGCSTSRNKFSENDKPNPSSDYSLSKYNAEQGLNRIKFDYEMEVVIIRPPMVYGRDAPGSYNTLQTALNVGFPLPFKSIPNSRSFVYIDNLIDFIECCMFHPNAANEIFLISDDDDVSTTRFIKLLGESIQAKVIFFHFSIKLMILIANIMGKGMLAKSIFSNLQVDITKAKTILDWKPKYNIEAAFKEIYKHTME